MAVYEYNQELQDEVERLKTENNQLQTIINETIPVKQEPMETTEVEREELQRENDVLRRELETLQLAQQQQQTVKQEPMTSEQETELLLLRKELENLRTELSLAKVGQRAARTTGDIFYPTLPVQTPTQQELPIKSELDEELKLKISDLERDLENCYEKVREYDEDANYYYNQLLESRQRGERDDTECRGHYDECIRESERLRAHIRELEEKALNDAHYIGQLESDRDYLGRDLTRIADEANVVSRDLNSCTRDFDQCDRDRDDMARELDTRDREENRLKTEVSALQDETDRLRTQIVDTGTARAERDKAVADLEIANSKIRGLEEDLRRALERERARENVPVPVPPVQEPVVQPSPTPVQPLPLQPPVPAPALAPVPEVPSQAPAPVSSSSSNELINDLIRQLLVCDFDLQTLTNATCERITRALDDFLSQPNASVAADGFVSQLQEPNGLLAPDVPLLREIVSQNASGRGVQPLDTNASPKELLEKLHNMYHRGEGSGEAAKAASLQGLRDFSIAFSHVYFNRMRLDTQKFAERLDSYIKENPTMAADTRALRERYNFDNGQWESWENDYNTAESEAIEHDRYAFTL